MSDGSLLFDTKLDTSGLTSGLGKIGGIAAGGLKVAAAATTAVAAGISAAGAASVKFGAEFESSMAKTATLFTGTDEEFKQLNSDILAISSATGQSAQALAEAAYSAESAGVKQDDLAKMLEASSKLAAAGFTDVDTALSATAKTMNAYGDSAGSIEDIQKVLIQTQNLGITTVGELGASLAQVTPTAAAFGVSFDQVGASLAVMTAAGTPTAQATTQLNTLIAELAKNGTTASNNLTKAAEGTEYAGMSFNEMMDAGAPLNDVLAMMSGYAEENGLSMVDMFSSIEAGKAALSIFGEDGEKFAETLAQMSTEADVVGAGFDTMMNTLDAKVGKLKETAVNFGISIYDNMQAPLMELADIGVDSLNKISEGFQKGGLNGAMKAVGEVLTNILNKLVAAAPEMLSAAMTLLGTLAQGIIDSLPQIIDVATELILTLAQGIVDAMPELIETGFEITAQIITGIQEALPELTTGALDMITALADGLIENAPTLITSAAEMINTLATGLGERLPELVPKAAEIVTTLVTSLLENAPLLINAALQLFVGLVEGIMQALPQIIAALPQIITAIVSALIGAIPQIIEAGFNLLVSLVTNLPAIIVEIVKAIPEIIKGIVQAFTEKFTEIKDTGKKMLEKIKDGFKEALSGVLATVKDIGKNIVDGIWNGISGSWSTITKGVSGLFSGLLSTAKDVLGIASPSKKFRYFGEMCVAGFDEGIEDLADMNGVGQAINASLGTISANINGADAVAGSAQTFNFYDTQTDPDAIRRKVQNTMTFGLAGAI